MMMERSYPVCGVGLGPSYRGFGGKPPTEFPLGNDATQGAPTPSPITYAYAGLIALKVAADCEHGDNIQIDPPSAAEIITRAPAADGLLAGVGIAAHVRAFHIIGTGAVPFTQKVELVCPDKPNPCPADPRQDVIEYPAPSPAPTP